MTDLFINFVDPMASQNSFLMQGAQTVFDSISVASI